MKNIDKLQQISVEEFAEYIDAVFLAGRLYEVSKNNSQVKSLFDLHSVNYID